MINEIVIPFQFNTAPIEDRLQEHGYEEIVRQIIEKAEKAMLDKLPCGRNSNNWYYDKATAKKLSDVDWKGMAYDRLDAAISEHMDEIVDEAALLLAMRGNRKKKWREVLAELKEEQ